MKKEYIQPSLKVMKLNLETVILAGSGNGVTGETSLSLFETSNDNGTPDDTSDDTVNWDF
jgi:hypothetical protein